MENGFFLDLYTMKIISVYKIQNWQLHLLFVDGKRGIFDIQKFVSEKHTNLLPLLDTEVLKEVEVVDGILTWPNVPIEFLNLEGLIQSSPLDLDPMMVYQNTEKSCQA